MKLGAKEREGRLIEEVERELPEFVNSCRAAQVDFVVMSQDAFAPGFGEAEIALLGKAVKYAGIVGIEVRVIPSTKSPS